MDKIIADFAASALTQAASSKFPICKSQFFDDDALLKIALEMRESYGPMGAHVIFLAGGIDKIYEPMRSLDKTN